MTLCIGESPDFFHAQGGRGILGNQEGARIFPLHDDDGTNCAEHDFFDGFVRGADKRHPLLAHHRLGFFHLKAAIVQRGVSAVRPAFRADLHQAIRGNGQAKQFVTMRQQQFGQNRFAKIFRRQRIIGGTNAVLQRQIQAEQSVQTPMQRF